MSNTLEIHYTESDRKSLEKCQLNIDLIFSFYYPINPPKPEVFVYNAPTWAACLLTYMMQGSCKISLTSQPQSKHMTIAVTCWFQLTDT